MSSRFIKNLIVTGLRAENLFNRSVYIGSLFISYFVLLLFLLTVDFYSFMGIYGLIGDLIFRTVYALLHIYFFLKNKFFGLEEMCLSTEILHEVDEFDIEEQIGKKLNIVNYKLTNNSEKRRHLLFSFDPRGVRNIGIFNYIKINVNSIGRLSTKITIGTGATVGAGVTGYVLNDNNTKVDRSHREFLQKEEKFREYMTSSWSDMKDRGVSSEELDQEYLRIINESNSLSKSVKKQNRSMWSRVTNDDITFKEDFAFRNESNKYNAYEFGSKSIEMCRKRGVESPADIRKMEFSPIKPVSPKQLENVNVKKPKGPSDGDEGGFSGSGGISFGKNMYPDVSGSSIKPPRGKGSSSFEILEDLFL